MNLRRSPYIWVTWLIGLLSGESRCGWAAWVKSNYSDIEKQPRDVNLTVWTAEHAVMVTKRDEELRLAGWRTFVESQNKFQLKGRVATLGGAADIVAIKENRTLVVDCKTGKPRDKDIFQVLIYMMVLPLTHPACSGRTLEGELQYRDGKIVLPADKLTAEVRGMITRTIESVANLDEPPPKAPSAHECRWCDIAASDCPERIDDEVQEVPTNLF